MLTKGKAKGVALVSTAREVRRGSYDEFVRDFMAWWEGELIRKGDGVKGPRLEKPDKKFKKKRSS